MYFFCDNIFVYHFFHLLTYFNLLWFLCFIILFLYLFIFEKVLVLVLPLFQNQFFQVLRCFEAYELSKIFWPDTYIFDFYLLFSDIFYFHYHQFWLLFANLQFQLFILNFPPNYFMLSRLFSDIISWLEFLSKLKVFLFVWQITYFLPWTRVPDSLVDLYLKDLLKE